MSKRGENSHLEHDELLEVKSRYRVLSEPGMGILTHFPFEDGWSEPAH